MVKEKNERKNQKEKTAPKKHLIIIVAVVIILALIAAATYFVPTILSSRRENISDFNQDYVSALDGDDKALLFSLESGEIKDIKNISGTALIFATNSLTTMQRDSTVIDVTKPGYSQPVVSCSGKNYIVYERSTGKFSIMDKNGTVHTDKLDSEIISAAVAENGNYIIISRKTLSSSLLTVYSGSNKILFSWECNSTYLTNCAISSNGKQFAVSTLNVENGQQVSSVLTFNTKSVDVEKEIEAGNEVVYALKFIGNGKIGIVTEKKYIIADARTGESESADYEYDVVSGSYFASNNNLAVLKSAFGSIDNNNVTVYDRNAKEIFSREVGEKVVDFCLDKSFVYVMTSGKITIYAISTGEEYSVIETAGGLKHINVFSGRLICSSDSGIYCYDR